MYIGIDLGTSNSSIAGIIDGKPRVFRPADGGEVLPSMIYFDKRNHRLFGRRAYDKALISPENVISGFKRLMGSATKLEVKSLKQELSPEECAAEIIRQLLAQAQTETGNEKIDGAVITIPASFNQTQSQATLKAAQMAGLERVDLLQEPIAAAIASMQGAKRSGKFIIYDLGGGTFDIALAQAMNGDVTILAHQGINMLGGRDFDRMIVKNIVRPWLEKMFSLPKGFAAKKEYVKVLRIAQLAAEKAKIDLSSMDSTSIIASDEEIGVQDQNGLEMYLDIPLSKEQFNEIIRPYVLKTIDVIRNMCEEAEVKTTDIDRIVFIGGSSKIPLIRDIVAAELDIAADMKTDPMTTVAIGAAYYCESREWSVDNKSSSGAAKKATVSQDAKDKKFEISYAFTARTPNDKSEITVILSKEKPADFKIKIKNQEWDSGSLPLMDELTIQIPLNNIGDNVFEALIFDKNGNEQSEYTQNITIKRLIATASQIPAGHTIAIKVRNPEIQTENKLVNIITKGELLPTQGECFFESTRTLNPGRTGSISFELFQVEYQENINLNLCIGAFRIEASDLPPNTKIEKGTPLIFTWDMSESGILEATVTIKASDSKIIELKTPKFYAPQAGQVSFAGESGVTFSRELMKRASEDLGDLIAATGPDAGAEVNILKIKLQEQEELINDNPSDPEIICKICEEIRFIRQDIAKIGKMYFKAMMIRRLGKLEAVFNRVAGEFASEKEKQSFNTYKDKIHDILDEIHIKADIDGNSAMVLKVKKYKAKMKSLFFSIAWRNDEYIKTWFEKLVEEKYMFTDKTAYEELLRLGNESIEKGNFDNLRDIVKKLLDERISLNVSETADELANIIAKAE